MNAIESCRTLVATATQNPLLERLLFASLEFAVLALVVAGVIWLGCIKSPRLAAILWLLVLAKPLASLLVGSPICILRVEPPMVNPVSEPTKPELIVEQSAAV